MIPDYIDQEAWKAFLAMRKRIKKPLSDRGITRLLNKLQRLHQEGHDPNECLDQSEFHCWQDVYPPKEDWNESGSNKAKLSATERAFQDFQTRKRSCNIIDIASTEGHRIVKSSKG